MVQTEATVHTTRTKRTITGTLIRFSCEVKMEKALHTKVKVQVKSDTTEQIAVTLIINRRGSRPQPAPPTSGDRAQGGAPKRQNLN
jgi:hypothetical protein